MFSKTIKSVVTVAGAMLSVFLSAAPATSVAPISQADWLQQQLAITDGNTGTATYAPKVQNQVAKDTKNAEGKQAATASGKAAETNPWIKMERITDGTTA